jgi:hypothetical protein
MEVEEEFLQNAATMLRFAEEEIKQFSTWTGKRSSYSRMVEEIRAKLQAAASDLKSLKKEYNKRPANGNYTLGQPVVAFTGTPTVD